MSSEHRPIPSWSPPPEAEPWWQALVVDSAAGVMVCNAGGLVLFANLTLAHLYGDGKPESLIGRTLLELFSGPAAEERMELVSHIIAGGQVRALSEIWRGTALVCTARRISSANGNGHMCLLTARRAVAPGFETQVKDVELLPARHCDMGPLGQLTQTELLVLSFIGKGLSTADIAKQLFRSTKTVEWHRAAIGQKLGASSRAQLVRVAIQAGLC
jgi:DNA-binding CsgD family transcriptional regulator